MVFDPTREEGTREPLAEPEPREEREADREHPREEESHPDERDLDEQAPLGPGP